MENESLSLNEFIKVLEEMDEALVRNDINAVTKKLHECIAKIKTIELQLLIVNDGEANAESKKEIYQENINGKDIDNRFT